MGFMRQMAREVAKNLRYATQPSSGGRAFQQMQKTTSGYGEGSRERIARTTFFKLTPVSKRWTMNQTHTNIVENKTHGLTSVS